MTEVRDFALAATRRYLQSVVFVDDEIYYEVPQQPVVVDLPVMKVFKPAVETVQEPGIPSVGSLADVPLPSYHPKQLVESFAKERMVCALYEPNPGFPTDPNSEVFKLCERADVVILDWDLYKEGGKNILPLIAGLVSSSQTTVPHHVRLCAIYTTTPDIKKVASQVYDHLKTTGLDIEPDGDLNLNAGPSRIVILGKPTTGRPQDQIDQAEVSELALASRIIEEFAAMHEGILPSLALDGLATVRSSTKKILDKFRADMDGAFLVHRGLLIPSDDPFEQIPELLAEEALAVMSDNLIDPVKAKKLADEIIDRFGISLDWEVKDGRTKPAPGVLATKLLKDGQNSIAKDFAGKGPWLTEIHSSTSGTNGSGEMRLAALYNTRTQYKLRKDLSFGTIVRRKVGEDFEYSVCLMPLCDSLRLKPSPTKRYNFPFWKLRPDNLKQQSRGVVVEAPDGTFVQLFSMGKPRDQMWIDSFQSSEHLAVTATETDGQATFVGTLGEIEWVAQLKPSHAQRIAQDIGSSFSRVGLIEAEWLRLKAER